ncbi:MAG: hypothetical protein PWQ15_532 [Methanobacterium sp.]|uniref:hypothetical protein n=1 Tax=Methanobacterium sp. TaxID=2164 RepID=UPI0024AC7CA9|nr:hypothetical protein [Methanobacterium sp.]MDI3549430.1 hypothetical protein [Methanobacterium sp.]
MSIRKPEKLAEGLSIYITELDFYRAPVTWGLVPWPFRTYFNIVFKLMSKYHFQGHNKDLYRKIRRDLDPFFKELQNYSHNDFVILYITLFIWLFFSVIISMMLFKHILYSLLSSLIIGLLGTCFVFSWAGTKRRRIAGEMYNTDLKITVQELVDYALEFYKTEKLDPKDFPIYLKNDDYNGLSYEKKGKNYKGYVVLDE